MWFERNAKGSGLLDPVLEKWREQYVTDEVSGRHHHQVGVGKAATASERDKTPTGITGASETAGVPQYSAGTGHLEQALKLLGPTTP